jgi:hypothetical protein
MMDPLLIAYVIKLGLDTVLGVVAAYKESGELRATFIDKKPEDFFMHGTRAGG